MQISEVAEQAMRHARAVKEEHVRQVQGRPGETDIRTVVEGFRGKDPAVVVFSPPDRDLMLTIADFVAVGFGADTVALTFEAYGVAPGKGQGTNPDTGQQWGPGEMAAYFERHGPGGVVKEGLMTSVYNRAGDCAFETQTYIIKGTHVRWEPLVELPETGTPAGYVHDVLMAIMEKPNVMTMALREHPEFVAALDHETAMYHADMGALRVMADRLPAPPGADVAVMLMAEKGSKRAELLRGRLGPAHVIDPDEWS